MSQLNLFSSKLFSSGILSQQWKRNILQAVVESGHYFSLLIEFEDRFKWPSVYADEGRKGTHGLGPGSTP